MVIATAGMTADARLLTSDYGYYNACNDIHYSSYQGCNSNCYGFYDYGGSEAGRTMADTRLLTAGRS